ncbi:MAG TPA: fibronectin type III domain-containing protein [Candidatus Acidoferrales bacterium]
MLNTRRALPIFYFLLSIFALSLSAGCGAPGEPSERKAPTPVAIADLAAAQQGDAVVLTFTLPKESVEHKTLKNVPAIEIYRLLQPASTTPIIVAANAAPTGELLVTIPPEMVDHLASRGRVRYEDVLTAADLSQNPAGSLASYLVRTRTSPKKVSANSNAASLVVQPAANPVSDLKAEVTREAIVLTWTPPQKTLIGATPPIVSYSIYRAESDATPAATTASPASANQATPAATSATEVQPPQFIHIGDIASPPYRDTQIQFGKIYAYSVRSVLQYGQLRVDSADSNLASLTRLDNFLPTSPEGLVVALIPAQDQSPAYLDLSWSISPDNDIAGYNIYRTEAGTPGAAATRTKLNPALLLTPAFRDMNVAPGRRYLYTVTAVNRAGNESPESTAVPGTVPDPNAPAESQP